SLTISAKPVGVGAVSQRWIAKDESGWIMRRHLPMAFRLARGRGWRAEGFRLLAPPQRDGDCQYDREYVHRDSLPFLFTADCEPRDLTETPVAGDESWHIETVAKRGVNKKALEQAEKA